MHLIYFSKFFLVFISNSIIAKTIEAYTKDQQVFKQQALENKIGINQSIHYVFAERCYHTRCVETIPKVICHLAVKCKCFEIKASFSSVTVLATTSYFIDYH